MSTSMATQNPEAAARMTAPVPMPTPGDTVMYHLRPGEMRAGQTSVPAFVLKTDEPNRMLKLLIMYDSNDMLTADRIPERIGTDMGWTLRPDSTAAQVAKLADDVAALTMSLADLSESHEAFKTELATLLLGEHPKPDVSFEDRMQTLQGNWAKIQPLLDMPVPAAPAKPRKEAPGKKGSGRKG